MKRYGALLFLCLSFACSDVSFDASGSHLALADRHDIDEEGNAFLRFEEDRTFSFLVSGATFSDDDWRGLSVRKQRVIEDEIKSHDAILVQNLALGALTEGVSLSLSNAQRVVLFSEPGRFLDEERDFTLDVDSADIEPTSGSLKGTLTFGSLFFDDQRGTSLGDPGEEPRREEHVIELDLDLGRERVVKENLGLARNFLICATLGDNCF